MSRSGYSDDLDMQALSRYRGQVASAIRGKRGQRMLREMLAALDAMPDKALGSGVLRAEDGSICPLGALGLARGVDIDALDPDDAEQVARAFDVAEPLAREVVFENDEHVWVESDEQRWRRMRAWVISHLRHEASPDGSRAA